MSTPPVFVSRVRLKNYKSISACDVELRNLTFLLGANGSGKSNFVDALRFVTDSLRASLDHALRDRGGIKEVRRRSGGHPTHFEIRLDFTIDGQSGFFAFRVGAKPNAGFAVQHEQCLIGKHFYSVEENVVLSTVQSALPASAADRLFLVNASGLPEFRPVYDALYSMGFYNLNPEVMRELQSPDPGKLLRRDGSNVASVLAQMSVHSPDVKSRVESYLAKVVPGVVGVQAKNIGPKETLEFRQKIAGAQNPWHFYASSMSDGTLRAFGVLIAIFQSANGTTVPLVAIEEPEVALHPAAAGVLRDSLRAATRSTQLVVTSHSPDLLDDRSFDAEGLLAVAAIDGTTTIGKLDEAGRRALRDNLFTPGELLRMDQLRPTPESVSNADRTPSLFENLR